MALKQCRDCGRLSDQTRCPTHRVAKQRERDAKRGSTTARGYGQRHTTERKRWEPIVKAGGVTCWRCGQLIEPTGPWDLGHDDDDRTKYRGPEHPSCNRATHGRKALPPRRWDL